MNIVMLSGRLSNDPELRATNGGTSVCNFSIAVDKYNTKTKEKSAIFVNCVAFGSRAEFIAKYFAKGSGMEVNGVLDIDNYTDKSGNKRYKTQILVNEAEFPKGTGKPNTNTPAARGENPKPSRDTTAPSMGDIENDFEEITDDEGSPF